MTSIPVTLTSAGMSASSTGDNVQMTFVNMGSTVLTKGGKSVLLVEKPLAPGLSQIKSGAVGKVTSVTPILSAKAVGVGTGASPSTISVPIKMDKGDLKVIFPSSSGEMISIMPGKRFLTPTSTVTTTPIINRLKVVGTQAQYAPGTMSTFTTSSLQNATLLSTEQGQPPTILLASPTKTFTVARGNTTQVLRALPGSPNKQGMVLFSPVKSKLSPMTLTTTTAAVACKSPQKIAPAPNTVSGSKVTIVTASPSSATTSTVVGATGTSILASTGTTIPSSPHKIIFRPLVPQVKHTGVPSNVGPGQTLTAGQTIKQMVVPVSSVLSATAGGHPIQVPGSKFNYFRLVSAPQTTSTTTTTVHGALKPATLMRTLTPGSITTAGGTTVSTASTLPSNPLRISVPIAPAVSVAQTQVLTKVTQATQQQQSHRILIPSVRPEVSASLGTATTATLSQFPPNTIISTNTPGGVQSFVMLSAQYLAQVASQAAGTAGATRVVIQPQASILPAPNVSASLPSQGFVPIAAAQPRVLDQQNIQQQQQQQQQQQLASQQQEQQFQQQQQQQSQNSAKQVNGKTPVAEPADSRIRKPCNCTKSQCLKLYCDCFANGEFCHNCNCNNCFNNLDHEEDRQRAIKSCLDRNPQAFHPKIGKGRDGDHERRHTKGCNCKRSGCLKNYCECYEAKILCTNLCKCVGCKNFEDSSERKTLMHLADAAEVRVQQQAVARTKISSQMQDLPTRPSIVSVTGERLPFSFVTQEVMEATCQCLLARAEDSERTGLSVSIMERLVLEEFGRCLLKIIDCANRTKASGSDH